MLGLLWWAWQRAVGTEYAAITLLRSQFGAAARAHVENLAPSVGIVSIFAVPQCGQVMTAWMRIGSTPRGGEISCIRSGTRERSRIHQGIIVGDYRRLVFVTDDCAGHLVPIQGLFRTTNRHSAQSTSNLIVFSADEARTVTATETPLRSLVMGSPFTSAGLGCKEIKSEGGGNENQKMRREEMADLTAFVVVARSATSPAR
jgi:hypothetical protein